METNVLKLIESATSVGIGQPWIHQEYKHDAQASESIATMPWVRRNPPPRKGSLYHTSKPWALKGPHVGLVPVVTRSVSEEREDARVIHHLAWAIDVAGIPR